MSNIVYPVTMLEVLKGNGPDFDGDTFHGVLVKSSGYTYNIADDNLDDIPGGARCTGGDGALGTLSVTRSTNVLTFDVADLVLSSVAGSQGTFDLFIVYKFTGTESTSKLVSKHDVSIAPNGGNITVQSASGIFDLTCTNA